MLSILLPVYNRCYSYILGVLALLLSAAAAADKPNPFSTQSAKSVYTGKIAIIMDDIGYKKQQGIDAINLPGAITYAIIPHSPNATFFALQAAAAQKEVILHAPMSNVNNMPLGENGLTEAMGEAHFKQTLNAALDSIPRVSGVNNHMGSLLTQKPLPMEWLMQSLNKRQLYFIDSRTTANSIAWQVAQNFNIPSLERDIFLDHHPNRVFIEQQFTKLLALAKQRGYAIAIAHPYPETIAYLQQQLPTLKHKGIQLVSASALVEHHSPNRMSRNHTNNVIHITKRDEK